MVRKPARFKPAKRPPPEQRQARRFTLLLRVGKLRTADGEFVCVLRDVSDNGIKVRVFHALPDDAVCELELSGGERFRVCRLWQKHDHVGFRFADGPIAVDRLIAAASAFPKRDIRLLLHRPVPILLLVEGLTLPARLCDISQHGAALALDQRRAIGRQVRIEALALPALHARVRWRRGSLHGLVFQEGFRLEALAALAARIQLDQDDVPDHPGSMKIGAALTGD